MVLLTAAATVRVPVGSGSGQHPHVPGKGADSRKPPSSGQQGLTDRHLGYYTAQHKATPKILPKIQIGIPFFRALQELEKPPYDQPMGLFFVDQPQECFLLFIGAGVLRHLCVDRNAFLFEL